jgi:hypothetical protein
LGAGCQPVLAGTRCCRAFWPTSPRGQTRQLALSHRLRNGPVRSRPVRWGTGTSQ